MSSIAKSRKRPSQKGGPLIREDLKKSEMDIRREKELAERRAVKEELEHPRWDEVWNTEFPPWFDHGVASPVLESLLEQGTIPNGRALVPGCSRGYDATALATDDRYVIGCDIVELAIQSANARLEEEMAFCETMVVPYKPPMNKVEFRQCSFFDLPTDKPEHLFDFIFDHGFLNALDPRVRGDYGTKMAELVKEDGILVTVLYPMMLKDGGPPFAIGLTELKRLLMTNAFKPLQLEALPAHLCLPGRYPDDESHVPNLDAASHNDIDGNMSNQAVTVLGVWKKIYIDEDEGFDAEFDAQELEHSI
jgi:hypothetical protein